MDRWTGYTCAYLCVVLLAPFSIREKSGDRAGLLLKFKALFYGRRNLRACVHVCFGSPTHSMYVLRIHDYDVYFFFFLSFSPCEVDAG